MRDPTTDLAVKRRIELVRMYLSDLAMLTVGDQVKTGKRGRPPQQRGRHVQIADAVARVHGRLTGPRTVAVEDTQLDADVVLVSTGARPRMLPGAEPDGERILTCRQVYDLDELPEELIVVGSGTTGAEFASAYQALGSQVTLVSSRDRVLPQEDADAAAVVEDVFRRRGMTVLGRSRAVSAKRSGDGVEVVLKDGRTVRGSHCLLTVGMVPNTGGLGLEEAGIEAVETDLAYHIEFAAQAILATGVRTTVDAIREALKAGSQRTLLNGLQRLWQDLG